MIDLSNEAKTYTDLTGDFYHQSSRNNNYIFAAYNYNGNVILMELMNNRDTATIIDAWKTHISDVRKLVFPRFAIY